MDRSDNRARSQAVGMPGRISALRRPMPAASVNGTTLYYEEQGTGTPLLFVHGMCADARVWSDQQARLAPRFRVIAYDRRGHTRSPLGQIDQRSVELHADDAAGLIENLRIAPCVLIGSSGGARVVLDVVRRYPHLLAGAVMSEPPVFGLYPEGAGAVLDELKPLIGQAMETGGPRAAVGAFFEYLCPGLWRTLPEQVRDRYRDNSAELFGDLGMPQYQVSRDDLARIDRPCLVISGSESHPTLQRIARIIAGAIPGCRFVELSGSGHVTYYERPAEFAAAVTSFAEGVTGVNAT